MNLPGHNYIGPGNPSDNGLPIDKDDEIAQVHDNDYDNATSSDDIRAADVRAIHNFGADVVETGNVHSMIGAGGLAAKYTVETVTGVLYPVVPDGTTAKVKETVDGVVNKKIEVLREKTGAIMKPADKVIRDVVGSDRVDSAVQHFSESVNSSFGRKS